MTDPGTPYVAPPPSTPPQAWGYLATFGWVLLSYLVATIASVIPLLVWNPAALSPGFDFSEMMKDARIVSISTIVTNTVQVGLLIWLAQTTRWRWADYLALNWPSRQEIVIALISLAILLPLLDGVSFLLGQPIIPPFQTDLYNSARSSGTLLLLWIAIVVAAPVAEEIVFRGFIFRGWVRSPQAAIAGILVISVFFAIIHLQYNWYGIGQVFCLGLLLTWTRWRSGSTLLPIAMHVIANVYAMLQTVAVIHWLS